MEERTGRSVKLCFVQIFPNMPVTKNTEKKNLGCSHLIFSSSDFIYLRVVLGLETQPNMFRA